MSYTVLNTFMYWHFCSYFYTKREFSLLGKAIYIPTTKGMPYSSLHKTITINLLNFVMFPEYEAFHTTGILWNQQQQKEVK